MIVAGPLLERERELTAFDGLLNEPGDPASGVVVVEGPAGIGKSRLLTEFRVRAEREGRRVLAARGSDLEREFPFGVVRQLFEPLLKTPEERERLLSGAAASAAAVFEEVGTEGDAPFAALHGLYWLTVNLAGEQPLLIAVDNLQACDRPSLRFLAYLTRRLEGLGTILALGLRTTGPGTDPVLIGELIGPPDRLHLYPAPLSEAGVAELIQERLAAEPDPAFSEACLTSTGGNPLLLRQLLSSLEADGITPEARQAGIVREVGPRAVSRTVLVRLHGLHADAAPVAQAVAVLGDGAGLPLVASLAEIDEPAVAAATAALARAEILGPDPPLAFVHPLIRDAVYHELPPAERELRHARAAQLLTDAGASAEELAAHLLASPRRGEEWVVDALEMAASSARSRGAADSAAAYMARALEEPPPPERRTRVLLELGLAETHTSGRAAAVHLREAWEALDDPRERARVATALGRTLVFTAPAIEALEFIRRAAAVTPPELVDERQALQSFELMAIPLGVADREVMTSLADVDIQGDGPGAKMLAAAASLGRALTGAPVDGCVALAGEALADGVLIQADPGFLPTPAAIVLVIADRDEAAAALEAMRAQAHRRGTLFGFLGANLWSGCLHLWRGDLDEAESTLRTALENVADWAIQQSNAAYGPGLGFLGAIRVLRGDLPGARKLLDPSGEDERRVESSRLTLSSLAELQLAERRHDEALATADDLAGRCGHELVNPAWAPWRSLKARALDGLGRTEEAIALAEEELGHARSFGSPSVVGRSLRVLGTLERERGLEHLREAVELLERSTAKLELAFGLFALGAALRRGGSESEAREPLRRALELAERSGADPLAAQVRTELHAAGGRPRTTLAGVEALTASERRVAHLAAEGQTNKEIAQALYVTPKTIELHLSHAYRKLGIRSRRDLGAALAGHP